MLIIAYPANSKEGCDRERVLIESRDPMTTKERHLLLLAENQQLETPRLLLRPASLADAADMFAYANDEETTTFVFARHGSVDETKLRIAEYFVAAPLGKYAIEEKDSGKMIGTIDLRVESEKRSLSLVIH